MPDSLTESLRELVRAEVQAALGDRLAALDKLIDAFPGIRGARSSAAPVRRGPGRPPRAAAATTSTPTSRRRAPPSAVKARSGAKAKASKAPKSSKPGRGEAGSFRAGQAVKYRQGRGEFEATVVVFDSDKGTVSLKRNKDGKKVVRPISKVYA